MGNIILDKITITPLKRIIAPGGNVLHAIKNTDTGYYGFGETYFSIINGMSIKAWKLHKFMILNLVVPFGKVKFVFCTKDKIKFREIIIGEDNYSRITVPAGIIFGFQGLISPYSIVMNVANIPHDPFETERYEMDEIYYNWE
jgi:dTDP-4-dehydrorhamnose 3,5-epimerase